MPRRSNEQRDHIPDRLKPQVSHLLAMLSDVNKSRRYPRPPEEEKFIADFFRRYLEERYRRSAEVNSPEVREAVAIASKLFPYPVYGVLCIDGRVLPPLVAGLMAKFGGFMRLPGGDLQEFVRGRDGELALIRDSHFAQLIDRTFEKHPVKIELLDSHLSCAAKGEEESAATGLVPKDGGLLADVERKKEIASAMKNYVAKRHPGMRIIPVQFSFDPHNGFGYMGLETDYSIKKARRTEGFTHEVLAGLCEEGKIISTEKFSKLPEVRAAFGQWTKAFELDKKDRDGYSVFDWARHYAKSALGFWKAVQAMAPQLLPVLLDEVLEIYPELAGKSEECRNEAKERAVLLLANAYSGYLNNLTKYVYGEHDEACVVVTEKEHGPFPGIRTFSVFSGDLKNMPANTVFASRIVRKNRETGRITAPNYPAPSKHTDYIKAPVPVVVHAIVHDEVAPKAWEVLEKVDWTDMEEIRWRDMRSSDFFEYLVRKLPNLPATVALGINRLREKMAFLYDPEKASARHFIDGNLVALPMVVDKNRCPHGIIPFIKKGFHT